MVRLLTWNCNGLSDERKITFFRSNFNDLKGVDFALLVETHLSDQNNHNCEGIEDFERTYNVVHSYREPNDSHAGLCFVLSKNYIIRETKDLVNGRIFKVLCESKTKTKTGTFYNIVGFYGLTSNASAMESKAQFQKIKASLNTDKINILMGDFNFVEDALDRNGKLRNNKVKDRQILGEWNDVKRDFDLINTFRVVNPLCRRYTFTHANKRRRSRIDRVYITDSEYGNVLRHNFIETPWNDHKVVQVKVSDSTAREPGQWALNTDLLKDPSFLCEIRKQWTIFAKTKSEFLTVLEWWNRAKAMIKTTALIFSIHKKQIQTDLEQVLQKERERLEILLGQCYIEQLEKELDCILKRQKELPLKKSEGHRIRARMEKIKSEGNIIRSLYDKNGVQQCETSQVLKITEDYYSDLFRAGKTNKRYQSKILSKTKVRISQNQQSFYDKDFELTELEKGMKKLLIGRSPGVDGLPVEFYRKMWPNIELDFLEMVKEVRNTKNLSDSQKKGVIRLIFKKEDRSDLKFSLPISLLNVHVKIITNTLALSLGRVLPSIISNDQTYTPGRNIASNLHTLNDIVKYANSKNIEAAILFLDQEKLF